jgi:hypothetical protein
LEKQTAGNNDLSPVLILADAEDNSMVREDLRYANMFS